MRDKIRKKKNPENHIVGFLKNLFANYVGIISNSGCHSNSIVDINN